MKQYCVILAILFLNSCKKSPTIDNTSNQTMKKIDTSTVIIVDKNQQPYIVIFQDKTNQDRISLTEKEIQSVDSILKKGIEKYNPELKRVHDDEYGATVGKDYVININDYKRQYTLLKDEKDEKIVWINCFCNPERNTYWLTKMVNADGGGKCYFSAGVNLTKKSLKYIHANGPV
jgi:hypothetical protein